MRCRKRESTENAGHGCLAADINADRIGARLQHGVSPLKRKPDVPGMATVAVESSAADVVATVYRSFMDHRDPLVLVTALGKTLLPNRAWIHRFGDAEVVAESVQDVSVADERGLSIAVRSPGREMFVQVPVRVIRLPDSALLIVDSAADALSRSEVESLRMRVSALERIAATDHLTGAWNRAHFDRLIEIELARSVDSRQPISLILIDIDHFKRVNDNYGHGFGDGILRELVRVLQSSMRAADVLFRWGGEEFVVLASSAGYRGAERLAETLRREVAEHDFRDSCSITVTAGVAEHVGDEDPRSWFGRLDDALYQGKRAGRNRVVVDRQGNSDAWASTAGSTALHLVWQEAYECGEPSVDAEHIHLFELANRTIDAAARQDRDPLGFSASLDTLLQHVQSHFAAEESLLARHHYIDLEPHRRAHAGLLRRAADLKAQAVVGGASLGSVVEFLAQEVVARHIMVVDRAFYPLFDRYVGRSELQP